MASTIFKPFPLPVDGRLATQPFLEGARGVVALVEQLGKVFAPVKYDMNGNIQKLAAKFDEDPKKFEILNDMILYERAEGGLRAADALLWLRRALHFIHNFLLAIVADSKVGKRAEDQSANLQKSYKETLERHHGFLAQRLFSVLSKMIPNRGQILRMVSASDNNSEDVILREMELFLLDLNSNITVLVKFYEDFKLNPPEP